jgi:hypothetical protein
MSDESRHRCEVCKDEGSVRYWDEDAGRYRLRTCECSLRRQLRRLMIDAGCWELNELDVTEEVIRMAYRKPLPSAVFVGDRMARRKFIYPCVMILMWHGRYRRQPVRRIFASELGRFFFDKTGTLSRELFEELELVIVDMDYMGDVSQWKDMMKEFVVRVVLNRSPYGRATWISASEDGLMALGKSALICLSDLMRTYRVNPHPVTLSEISLCPEDEDRMIRVPGMMRYFNDA